MYIMLNGELIEITPEIESKLLGFSRHELMNLTAANDIKIDQIPTNRFNQKLVYANFGKS